jgi:uncharacterized membrane protein (UPF0127 family)/CheY-like chemotaxis protein
LQRDALQREKGRRNSVVKTKLIVNLTHGGCMCVSELADRPLPRMKGLIGRRGLPAGEGLLLTPAPAIHTAFMRFPIDALFLDRNLRVVNIVECLRPWRIAAQRRARAVLELAAGECARRGVEVGDRLELRDRDSEGARQVAVQTAEEPISTLGIVGVTRRGEGELQRVKPLRVLVISPDNHFRSVMSLLLARRNCSVTATANAGRVIELILRESPDVVVVEDVAPTAAAVFAAVNALRQPIGVVVVADEAGLMRCDPPVLAKWGPFEELLAAIERADEQRV